MEAVGRIVMIGDASVGKTSLVGRLFGRPFDVSYQETIGAAFHTYSVESKPGSYIQVWDTAGEERYRSLGPIYFRKSSGAVLVYDLAAPETVRNLESWLVEFRSVAGETAPVFVVANKTDLVEGETEALVQGRNWACAKGLDFFETSAKEGTNVKQMFQAVFAVVMKSVVDCDRRGTESVAAEAPKRRCC